MTATELFSEDRSAEVVAASFAETADPRLREVMTSLVRAPARTSSRTSSSPMTSGIAAIDFLTRTGQMCDDVRQEFILLSDVLGVSMLVETINNRTGGTPPSPPCSARSTWSSHRRASSGDDIASTARASPAWSPGRVTGAGGEPLAGATVDVWQANDDGFYDVQQPGVQPERNLRGLFTADADGRFWFRTVVPALLPDPGRRAGRRAAARRPAGTRTGRRTCTSSSARRATGR